MFASFGRSWELLKMTWGILMRDRKLLVFPLLSLIGAVVVSAVFFAVVFIVVTATGSITLTTLQDPNTWSTAQKVTGVVVLFLYYLVLAIVTIYSNTALTGAVFKGFAGGTPTLNDGFQVANSRLGKIVGYAAITATVGIILALIRAALRSQGESIVMRVVGGLTAGLLQAAWSVVTFLTIPVLVAENVGPITMIKRSGQLLKDTWGRQITGSLSMGGIAFLITLAAIVVIGVPTYALYSASQSVVALIAGGALFVVVIMAISLVQGAVSAIFRVALYRYANDHQAVYYNQGLLQGAFRVKSA
jgi:hypothetical protein